MQLVSSVVSQVKWESSRAVWLLDFSADSPVWGHDPVWQKKNSMWEMFEESGEFGSRPCAEDLAKVVRLVRKKIGKPLGLTLYLNENEAVNKLEAILERVEETGAHVEHLLVNAGISFGGWFFGKAVSNKDGTLWLIGRDDPKGAGKDFEEIIALNS
jgi:hypothetical protein